MHKMDGRKIARRSYVISEVAYVGILGAFEAGNGFNLIQSLKNGRIRPFVGHFRVCFVAILKYPELHAL